MHILLINDVGVSSDPTRSTVSTQSLSSTKSDHFRVEHEVVEVIDLWAILHVQMKVPACRMVQARLTVRTWAVVEAQAIAEVHAVVHQDDIVLKESFLECPLKYAAPAE